MPRWTVSDWIKRLPVLLTVSDANDAPTDIQVTNQVGVAENDLHLTKSHLLRKVLQRRVEVLENEKQALRSQIDQLEERLAHLQQRGEAWRDDALRATVSAAEEAVALLLPFFERLPAAFADQMRNHLGNYLERCQEAGQEPEAEIVNRVLTVFQSLEAPSPDPPDS